MNGTFSWTYQPAEHLAPRSGASGPTTSSCAARSMTFQSQTNLPVTGEADPTTWSDLLNAVNDNTRDPATYNYVDVSETLPETLTLYVAGKVKFTTSVNTGIEPVPTELGTYPVYERFVSHDHERARTPTARRTATPTFPGSPTSTAATRCTASFAPPTASPRASAVSRCPSPQPDGLSLHADRHARHRSRLASVSGPKA